MSQEITKKHQFFSNPARSITAWPPKQLIQVIQPQSSLVSNKVRSYTPLTLHASRYITLGEEWPIIGVETTEDSVDEEILTTLATPVFKRPEDVTITPNSDRKAVPEKIISATPTPKKPIMPSKPVPLKPVKIVNQPIIKPIQVQSYVAPPKNAFDIKFLKVQELSQKLQDKARYIIEQIMFVPGRHLINLASVDIKPSQTASAIKLKSGWVTNKKLSSIQLPRNEKLQKFMPEKMVQNSQKQEKKEIETSSKLVKVDSVGMVSADKPITGYEAYFPDSTDDEATLILEPQSRAIAGNGGTAISAPVSRAILKRGSRTKVLFKPQSVAIAGARGKAHASADLILDYVE